MRMARTDRPHADYFHGGKTVRDPRKEQTHNKERTSDISTKILKETNLGNGRDNRKEIGKWETIFFYY